MSAEATGFVFRNSPYTHADFAVHLAIADSVNDQNDNEFWMAVGRLADKSRTSRRSVQRALRRMEDDGFLRLIESRPGGTCRYQFLFPLGGRQHDARATVTPGATPTPRGATVAPKPKKNPKTFPPTPQRGEEERVAALIQAAYLACRIDPATVTARAARTYRRAVDELAAVDATVADVAARAGEHRQRWPQMPVTPASLAKHWAELRPAGRAVPIRPLQPHPVEDEDEATAGDGRRFLAAVRAGVPPSAAVRSA